MQAAETDRRVTQPIQCSSGGLVRDRARNKSHSKFSGLRMIFEFKRVLLSECCVWIGGRSDTAGLPAGVAMCRSCIGGVLGLHKGERKMLQKTI